MGIDAGTDLVYGFILTNPSKAEIEDLLEQWGIGLANGYDDDFGDLHNEQVGNSKYMWYVSTTSYCFSFGIVAWTHSHQSLRSGETPKQVKNPNP